MSNHLSWFPSKLQWSGDMIVVTRNSAHSWTLVEPESLLMPLHVALLNSNLDGFAVAWITWFSARAAAAEAALEIIRMHLTCDKWIHMILNEEATRGWIIMSQRCSWMYWVENQYPHDRFVRWCMGHQRDTIVLLNSHPQTLQECIAYSPERSLLSCSITDQAIYSVPQVFFNLPLFQCCKGKLWYDFLRIDEHPETKWCFHVVDSLNPFHFCLSQRAGLP